jgi:hypothetical protein
MTRRRQLGNPTNKAWLAGWDAGICGLKSNPYVRRPQADAWERGRQSGLRSNDADVAGMKRRAGYGP